MESPSSRRGRSPSRSSVRGSSVSPSGKSSRSSSPRRGRSRSPSQRRASSRGSTRSGSPSRKSGKSRKSSKSPTRFSEDDFDGSKETLSPSERRKRAVAKIRGLKLDPKDWTRAEIMEKIAKFAKFQQDKKTGEAEVKALDGIRISAEDVIVLCELIRRTTEIQRISLRYCSLNDEQAVQILNALKGVRHLKEIDLSQNVLTSVSIEVLITNFSKISRKPESINIRDNPSLSFDDAERLFLAFPYIGQLNMIPVAEIRKEEFTGEVLDLSEYEMKLFEVGIAKRLILEFTRLKTVNVRNNFINAKGLEVLFQAIQEKPSIRNVDLSFNPITNEGKDLSAIQIMQQFLQGSTQILQVHMDGIVLSAEIQERISRALAVNRSVEGKKDGYYFNKFAAALVQSRMPKFTKMEDIQKWQPKLNAVDESFVRHNRLRIPDVVFNDEGGFNIVWKRPDASDSFSYEYAEEVEDDLQRLEKTTRMNKKG